MLILIVGTIAASVKGGNWIGFAAEHVPGAEGDYQCRRESGYLR